MLEPGMQLCNVMSTKNCQPDIHWLRETRILVSKRFAICVRGVCNLYRSVM